MNQKIKTQLGIIEKSLKWVKETDSMRGAKGENAYSHLVNFRRKLKKKQFALEGNPAAAMYGESQMGKSYLAGSLLSENGKPFNVIDGEGNSYDFINKINPIGKGAESTSLITRFSTDYKWRNARFPVKAKLLTPSDLVLVLCDFYYNDVKTKIDNSLKGDAISETVNNLCEKYESKSTCQTLFGEDEVLDIYDYFHANFSTKASSAIHSTFFKRIPALVEKTMPTEWCEIFQLLWNNNNHISKLFSELIKQFEKLSFSNEIFLPIDAVLRDNGTLLDVTRLHELYGKHEGSEPNYQPETSLLIIKNDKEEIINSFSKSYLCALTAELVFCLPNELESSKQFLKNADLLDFPGARHRLGIHEEDIEDKIIPQMLLRGKVAYLFNKYSSSEKINILLFCHNDKMSAQSVMPEMLNNWISDMIGKTPEARNTFIDNSKIPPLFVISTMFNLDLAFDFNNDREGNIYFLDNRWDKRFIKVLKREIFGEEIYQNHWLTRWTTTKANFQNIYLLRDFYYSAETNSKIFKGYNEDKTELEEIVPSSYPNFRKDLRQSFLNNDFVIKHFENPELSWDSAASINQDGTQLIIDRLDIATKNINSARREKNLNELNEISKAVTGFLNEYYNSPDKADSLKKAIATAGSIQANLDIAFSQNPYFFGTMMKEFMLSNSDVYHLFMHKIHDIERRNHVNMDKYSAIRISVPEISHNNSFEVNLEYLRKQYEIQTSKECLDFFEKEKAIDLNELFYGNIERVKNFSDVLADTLVSFWLDQHLQSKKAKFENILSDLDIQNIYDMFRGLFKKLKINEVIAEKIRLYVDVQRSQAIVYEMIADISSELINKFVNSVGIEFYNESNKKDLETVSENINGLFWEHKELQFEHNSKSEVAELIIKMNNLPALLNRNPLPKEELKLLPNFRSYIIWRDLLKAGFVTASGVPNYDPIANEKLSTLINELNTIEY